MHPCDSWWFVNMLLCSLRNGDGRNTVFLRATARSGKRLLPIVILSVCPSVCHDPVRIQTQVR